MQTRQSGAAHVPIMFFLILLVIFLGTLGFAYVTLTENGELIQERDEAVALADAEKAKALLVEHYIADIGAKVGIPASEYQGRAGSSGLYNGNTLTSEGVMDPDAIKAAIDKACQDAGVSVGIGLPNVLNSMVTKISQLEQAAKDARAERDAIIAKNAELQSSFSTATADAAAKGRDFDQSLETARSTFAADVQRRDTTIANLQQNLVDKDDEMNRKAEENTANEKKLKGEIAELRNQNSYLTSRETLRKPANVADGKVIAARQGVRTAYIDLGKKDLLQENTIFRIQNPRQEGVKGYARVIRVEPTRAEVEISGVVDPVGDFVREGDLLFNDLYTPNMPRTIYLMGRFSAPYNKDTIATLLRGLGNKVVTRMGPGVDTVVLGNDPLTEAGDGFAKIEDSEEYKKAVQLRVEFAPLLKIRDLITPTR